MRTIATVGVYQSSLDDFLDKLKRHRVAMVADGRQRPDARACHRSLIAARLQAQCGVPVLNL